MLYTSEHQPHTSRVLRSFRSHKSLKSEASRQQPLRITHVSYENVRRLSGGNSFTRASLESNISRPSTSATDSSSTSSTSTIEWDPLRLHPAMATPNAPMPERESQHEPSSPRSATHSTSYQSLQDSRRSAETEIHGGFDFGFSTPARAAPSRPTPVSAWSYSTSLSSMADSEFDGPASEAGPEPGDDHAVTPRPHRNERDDQADYFMKRGGWKRRGIVFASGVTMADEEECFDLEH